MKKNILILFFISFVIILSAQEKVYKYDINVKNKVIYARVFHNGKLVDNLTKDDFILYENGKRMKIIGVDVLHKTFGSEEINLKASINKKYKPRFFILTFKIIDCDDYLKNGVDYLFDKVLRAEDKLMFMSEHNYFVEDNLKNKKRVKKKIMEILKRESVLSRMNLNRLLNNLKSLTFSVREYLSSQSGGMKSSYQLLREFEKLELIVQRFLVLLREYRLKYLTPDIDRFYYFSEYLNGVKMKKWIINFYQIEKIPVPTEIKDFMDKFTGGNTGEQGLMASKEIKAMEMRVELERELNMPGTFPSKEVAKLFYKGDTTFYTILLNKSKETLDKDYYYKNIYTDLEKTLKDISFSTGGEVVLSNNIEKSVDSFKRKKDILYLINYMPTRDNPKLKIKMKNREYKVKYDPDQFSDYIKRYINKKRKENPDIIIDSFKFINNSVRFGVSDFKTDKMEGKQKGRIAVALKITGENGKTVFNKRKILETKGKLIKLNIKLNNISPGIYYLYLDVYDLITKKMTSKFEVIEIK
jgi:predicted CopG family antitoxin